MKKTFLITTFILISFAFLLPKQGRAATCTDCPSGQNSCQNGAYCCGPPQYSCPSYACTRRSDCITNPVYDANNQSCGCFIFFEGGQQQWKVWNAEIQGGTCQACGGETPPPPGNGGGEFCFEYECVIFANCPDINEVDGECEDRNGQPQVMCKKKIDCPVVCTPTPIDPPVRTSSPTNSAVFDYDVNITFSWSGPDGWGSCCGSCGKGYRLYVTKGNGVWTSPSYDKSKTSVAISASTFGEGAHSWYVQAYNGDAGKTNSTTKNFTVNPPPVTVRGYIWNSTDQACNLSQNQKASREIVLGSAQGNVATNITLLMDGTTNGTWNTSASNYSYRFTNVAQGTHSLSATVPDPVGYPNSTYELACVNNSAGSVIPSVNASADPTTLDLGYVVTTATTSWFQSIGGDIFGGCENCANSVSIDVPGTGETLGGFVSYLISTAGTLFGDSGLSITNDSYSQDSNRHLEYMGSDDLWPSSLTFTPPSSAQEVSDCPSMFQGNELDAEIVYKASVDCVQDGLDGLNGNYNFTHDGVAVVYVEGTDTLTFDKNLTASTDSRRVLFITQGPVEFSEAVGTPAPTPSADAHIQAGIISAQNISFLAQTPPTEDTTIIVEGPLVTKDGSIVMNRNRGINNGYPAVVVLYNPLYLISLTSWHPAGLSAVDISWVLN